MNKATKLLTLGMMLSMAPVAMAQEDDDPLAELAALGDSLAMDGPESGGSIRAKKDADNTDLNRRKDVHNIQAKVVTVTKGDFPKFALKLKITKAACAPAKKGAKPTCDVPKDQAFNINDEIVVVPVMAIKNGQPDMKDAATLLNAGSFYLRNDDKVVLRLKEKKGKVWMADYIERN